MKLTKRMISALLALILCFSLSAMAFADEDVQDAAYKEYQSVFVHGLFGWGPEDGLNSIIPYWGMTSGNVMEYLTAQGYDVVAATVGPMSSCWDRCCELYAQLTGTQTDYGEAHVEKMLANFKEVECTLGHERFGRDYTDRPIVDGWGPKFDDDGSVDPTCYDVKLNLIGHSFGGPTVVMLLQLLAKGDESERSYAQAKYGDDWKQNCSPLFWGGYEGEKLVNSITSLAGVLNGTTFIDCCDDSTQLLCSLGMGIANAIGPTCFNQLYDFQLEQFGITKSSNPDYEYMFNLLQSVKFLDTKDNSIYDLSIRGCNELKQGWECYEDVFYFAYPGCCTSETMFGTQLPNIDTWPLFMPFATAMGAYINNDEEVLDIYGDRYCGIDARWLPNDGMVNTFAQTHVFGCRQKYYYDGAVEPGMWITMPSYGYDHFDYGGGLIEATQNSWQTKAFYDDVMKNIEATYSYVEKLDAPEVSASNVDYSNSVKLAWNEVEGATAYKVYRASSKNGSYALLTTTHGTSYRDYATVLGKTYYYRVTAINGNNAATSEYSNVAELFVTYSKLSTYIVSKVVKRLF